MPLTEALLMSKISTRKLNLLPDIEPLKKLLQALATLDAILSPEWEYRYFSFNSYWSEGEEMGSLRNGCGDEFFALFNAAGCFLKGFAHEAPMSPWRADPPELWPGLLEGVPPEFASALAEPAFSMEAVTCCIWRKYGDRQWSHGPVEFPKGKDPDGSAMLLSYLDGSPQTYVDFATDYYETELPLEAVQHVYDHRPLDKILIQSLNPDLAEDDMPDLELELDEIGYPEILSA